MHKEPFSDELEAWLKSGKRKTLAQLDEVFQERSFAITILLLMAVPALPIPTGGITHIFEVIAVILALEMIAGRSTILLPKKWKKMKIGSLLEDKAIPVLIKTIRWFEKFSRPRFRGIIMNKQFSRLAGVVLVVFCTGAFISPPFSGLDTLPALGAVIVCLSMLLGDALVFILGCVIGAAGIGLTFLLGKAALSSVRHFF